MSRAADAVSIRELWRDAELEAPFVSQRRVARWLDAMRTYCEARGHRLLQVAGIELDVLQCLRSPVLLRGGIALRQVATLQVVQRHAGRPILLADDDEEVRLVDVAQAIGARGIRRPRFEGERLRRWAYALRRELAQRATPRRSLETQARVDVLAFPRSPNHLADQRPVLSELERAHGWRALVVHVDARTAAAAKALSFPARSLHDFSPRMPGGREAKRLRRGLLAAIRGAPVVGDVTAEEHQALQHVAGATVAQTASELVRLVHATRKMAERLQPKVVLAGNPYTFEGRVVGEVARSLGIPVACIEHGSIFPEDPLWQDCPLDLACAWGDSSAAVLRTTGLAADKIVVTGSPRLDVALAAVAADVKRDAVLVATSGPGDVVSLDQHLRFIDLLLTVAQLAPHATFRVRLHRKDSVAHYVNRPSFASVTNVVVEPPARSATTTVYDELARAHAVVTVSSTVAVEAMVCGVPTIVVPADGAAALAGVEYLSPQLTLQACNAEQLAAAVNAALSGNVDPAVTRAARAYADRHFAHRGESATRVATALVRLAHKEAA